MGCWVGVIMLILVATDASAFVCYITRFTEENFATLIAFIFIKKAVEKVIHISDYYPIHESPCFCAPKNETLLEKYGTSANFTAGLEIKPHKFNCSVSKTGSNQFLLFINRFFLLHSSLRTRTRRSW